MTVAPVMDEHLFDSAAALEAALAEHLADRLRTAVAERGAASLVGSGGTTPGPVYDRLSQADLPWDKVVVTASDERWAPEDSPASNARLIGERLLAGPAGAARYVSLFSSAATPFAAEPEVGARIAALPYPFTVVVLGMGPDGHTASLFPGVDGVAQALDTADPALVRGVGPVKGAAGAPFRITLTLRALMNADEIILLFRGVEKLAVYRAALADRDVTHAPVSAVLHQTQTPVSLYWSP